MVKRNRPFHQETSRADSGEGCDKVPDIRREEAALAVIIDVINPR